MNSAKPMFLFVLLVVVGGLLNASFFIVKENEVAMRLQLGEIVDSNYDSGLHFKTPLMQSVKTVSYTHLTLPTNWTV